MKSALAFSLFTLAFVAACATAGRDFDIRQADGFQPGVTSLREAESRLGPPYSTKTEANGSKEVKWASAMAVPGRASLKRLVMVFDANGIMTRVAERTE